MQTGSNMPSPSAARRRRAATALLTAVLVSSGGLARADDKQACIASYDQTQKLRKGGKLGAAREQALVCLKDACAEFIRADCARWFAEIEASQPTVVFEVRDA